MPTAFRLLDARGALQHQIQLPQGWAEVSLQQFVAVYAPKPVDEGEGPLLVECLLNLPAGTLAQLSTDQALWLSAQLAFVLDLDQLLAQEPPAHLLPDVGQCTFGAFLLAQHHTQAHEGRPWPAYGPHVLAIYLVDTAWGEKYTDQRVARCLEALLAAPVTETAPACRALLNQLVAFAENYAPDEEDQHQPTDEELDAGSEEFAERFSSLLPMDAAAGGQLLDYQKVLKLDAATVMAKLLLEGARAAIYRRIYQAREAAHSTHH